MSKNRYKQDYLAEFLSTINQVFPKYDKVMVKPPPELKTEKEIDEFLAQVGRTRTI